MALFTEPHDRRVSSLADCETGHGREHDLPDRPESDLDAVLFLDAVIVAEAGKDDDHPIDERGDDVCDETHGNSSGGRLLAIQLSDGVTHDVGDWEHEEGAIGDDVEATDSKYDALCPTDAAQDHDDAHDRHEDRVVSRPVVGVFRLAMSTCRTISLGSGASGKSVVG